MYIQNLAHLPSFDYKICSDPLHLYQNDHYLCLKRRVKPTSIDKFKAILLLCLTLGFITVCPCTRQYWQNRMKGKPIILFVREDLLSEQLKKEKRIGKHQIENLKQVVPIPQSPSPPKLLRVQRRLFSKDPTPDKSPMTPIATPAKEVSKPETPISPSPCEEESIIPSPTPAKILSPSPSPAKKSPEENCSPREEEKSPPSEPTLTPAESLSQTPVVLTTPQNLITSPSQCLLELLYKSPEQVWKHTSLEVREDPDCFKKLFKKTKIAEAEIPPSIMENEELWKEIAEKNSIFPGNILPEKWRHLS